MALVRPIAMKTTMFVSLALIACCVVPVAVHGRLLDENFFEDLQKDSKDDSEINELTIHHRDNTEYCLFNSNASFCVDISKHDLSQDTGPGRVNNETNRLGQIPKQLQQQQRQQTPATPPQQQKNELDAIADQHNRQKRSIPSNLWPCIAGFSTCAATIAGSVVTVGAATPFAAATCATSMLGGCVTTVGLKLFEIFRHGQNARVGYAQNEHFEFVHSDTLLIEVPNSQLTQCRVRRKKALTDDFKKKHVITDANQWNMLEQGQFDRFLNTLPSDVRNLISSRPMNTFINLVDRNQHDEFIRRSNDVPCAQRDPSRNPPPTDMGDYHVITFNRGERVGNRSGCRHVFVNSRYDQRDQVNHLAFTQSLAALACSRISQVQRRQG